MTNLLIFGLFFLGATAIQAQNVAGDWLGTLSAGGTDLHLALHISKSDSGVYFRNHGQP